MKLVSVVTELSLVECASCHVTFGIPEGLERDRRRDHKTFWCPNGHSLSWGGESDLERCRRELRAARARSTHLEDQALAAERSARAYKGQATRARKRAAAGVCPAPGCHRTFQDLARHMAGQHPGFQAEHAHPEPAP